MGCAVRLSDHGSVGGRLIPSGCPEPAFNATFRFLHEGAQKMAAAASPMRAFRACTVPDRRLLGAHDSTTYRRAEFPGGREKCREFRRISLFLRKSVLRTCAISAICEKIPYAAEQGIFSGEQGMSSAFSTAAGNLARRGGPRHLSDGFRWRGKHPIRTMNSLSGCRWKAKEPALQLAPRLAQFFPMSRRGADTAQPLAARTRNPIERPVAWSGR